LTGVTRPSALAPFRVRSYRFQWPADLSTSWAFEMETIILGWYILVATGSVLMLTLFASLQYTGTLLAPMFGVIGNRIGNKLLLCLMRASYALLATTLMTLAYLGWLVPVYVFIIGAAMGVLRPSDLVMRYALIGETIPSTQLMSATSISRTTQDSARIVGALTGASLFAALGMGPAYTLVATLYVASLVLTLRVGARVRVTDDAAQASTPVRTSPWRDLREGFAYVWNAPPLLAGMYIALLVNVVAFPLVHALMPYVAREIYGTDQRGLGYLVAGFASGALVGSLILSRYGSVIRAGRTMLIATVLWFVLLLVFAWMESAATGLAVLVITGFAQSLSMVPLSAILLRNTPDHLRSRVMGIRMLMVYGVPVGLLISGPLIDRFGFPATATLYALTGLALMAWITMRWRSHFWNLDAPANRR
jgi:predicted MFS family arabinose efflux permease